MVSDEYIEAVLTMRAADQSGRAERWLLAHGLRFMPLRLGLLVQGNREAFDRAFGVDLREARLPTFVPVPAELSDAVASITIPPPRQYYSASARGETSER